MPFITTSAPISTRPASRSSGTAYIVSRSTPSMMARNPRAPVPRSIAWSATAARASSLKTSSTPSSSNILANWRTRALRGSVRMRTRASLSRSSTVATTGRRPMNSGINPYFTRSSGSTSTSSSDERSWRRLRTSAPKPTARLPMRFPMISSMPANAPPTMKSTLVVSIWRNS